MKCTFPKIYKKIPCISRMVARVNWSIANFATKLARDINLDSQYSKRKIT